jgi:hypothetical protein
MERDAYRALVDPMEQGSTGRSEEQGTEWDEDAEGWERAGMESWDEDSEAYKVLAPIEVSALSVLGWEAGPLERAGAEDDAGTA